MAPLFDRRTLLRGLTAATVLPGCGGTRAGWLASASGDTAETYGLTALPLDGGPPIFVATGFRGHGLAARPEQPGRVFLFERRPGRRLVEVDLFEGREVRRAEAADDRAFAGHGCLSADGRHLYTSEADRESGAGRVGIRETSSLRWEGEIDSGGFGPHELLTLSSGALVVANGGLLSRPEVMDPSLALIDPGERRLVELHRLPYPQASVRHLDADSSGRVVVGLQVQRDAVGDDRAIPLAASWSPGGEFAAWPLPPEGLALRDYVGSVAVAGSVVGLTSPRGDVVVFLERATGAPRGLHDFADVSGIAPGPDGRSFILTSSFGQVRTVDAVSLSERREARWSLPSTRWDNHACLVPAT